ncbi:glycoprotein hormones alpha chain [Solea senegalensis]|nr:glycoprotein hormones alpha chain [Solea senegalensis]
MEKVVVEIVDKVNGFSLFRASGIKRAGLKQRSSVSGALHRRTMKGTLSLNMAAATTTVGSVKSVGLSLLLLSFFLYIADSYPNIELPDTGCEKCTLRKSHLFSREHPVYQCKGCCFSRAYPTPLKAMQTMPIPKNITSEATCCVAKHSYETEVAGIRVKNHTDCHCSTCFFHKI